MRLKAGIRSTSFETVAVRLPQDEVGCGNFGKGLRGAEAMAGGTFRHRLAPSGPNQITHDNLARAFRPPFPAVDMKMARFT